MRYDVYREQYVEILADGTLQIITVLAPNIPRQTQFFMEKVGNLSIRNATVDMTTDADKATVRIVATIPPKPATLREAVAEAGARPDNELPEPPNPEHPIKPEKPEVPARPDVPGKPPDKPVIPPKPPVPPSRPTARPSR